MKIEAISILERAYIIRVLKEQGKWEATRLGAHIQICRYKAAAGTVIQYYVARGTLIISGQAETVGAAVQEINGLIAGRKSQHAPAISSAAIPRPQREEWLPYKDA